MNKAYLPRDRQSPNRIRRKKGSNKKPQNNEDVDNQLKKRVKEKAFIQLRNNGLDRKATRKEKNRLKEKQILDDERYARNVLRESSENRHKISQQIRGDNAHARRLAQRKSTDKRTRSNNRRDSSIARSLDNYYNPYTGDDSAIARAMVF